MSRYRKSMAETMADVEKIGQELPEVSPPGWEGSVKAMKKHKDIDNPWALAWHMKNKGDKPHYKDQDGKPEKKAKYKNEEVETGDIVQLNEGKPDFMDPSLPSPDQQITDPKQLAALAKAKKDMYAKKKRDAKKEEVELDEKHDCDEVHPDMSHEDWTKIEVDEVAPLVGMAARAIATRAAASAVKSAVSKKSEKEKRKRLGGR